MNLRLVDVEIPAGPRFEHHVLRVPQPAAGTIVFDPAPDRGVLLLWRHRFITDSWGWEIPAGRVDPGETPEEAAAREAYEETGWRAGPLTHLLTYHPTNGMSDAEFHVFLADGAEHVGEPVDASEAERIEWVPVERVQAELRAGHMGDGLSVTALCYFFAFVAV